MNPKIDLIVRRAQAPFLRALFCLFFFTLASMSAWGSDGRLRVIPFDGQTIGRPYGEVCVDYYVQVQPSERRAVLYGTLF